MKNTRVNVAIRIRPLLELEINKGETTTEKMIVDKTNSKITLSNRVDTWYTFDQVIQDDTQGEVYEKLKIDNYIKQVVDGYHATIFAYGQTGSGKTYTMEGYEYSAKDSNGPKVNIQDGDHVGIAPRAIKSIFNMIHENSRETKNSYKVYCSFLQLYQE